MKACFIIIALIIAIATPFALYQGLTIRYYQLCNKKITPGKSVRLVLISDLHSLIYGQLIEEITEKKPDIILLAGDIGDDNAPFEGAAFFLDSIRELAPVFYVTGNHEYRSGKIADIRKIITDYGIQILADDYQKIAVNGTTLIIAGIDDPAKSKYENKTYSQPKSMEKAFTALIDTAEYKILIAHRPEQIELYKKYSFDLVVSGHTHGGQVRIPFLLNGLWAPHQGLFPKYAGGIYQHGDLTHIISRGVSFRLMLPRIFNPPEIVVVDLTSS